MFIQEKFKKGFSNTMGLPAYALTKAIGVDQTRISQLIKGK